MVARKTAKKQRTLEHEAYFVGKKPYFVELYPTMNPPRFTVKEKDWLSSQLTGMAQYADGKQKQHGIYTEIEKIPDISPPNVRKPAKLTRMTIKTSKGRRIKLD